MNAERALRIFSSALGGFNIDGDQYACTSVLVWISYLVNKLRKRFVLTADNDPIRYPSISGPTITIEVLPDTRRVYIEDLDFDCIPWIRPEHPVTVYRPNNQPIAVEPEEMLILSDLEEDTPANVWIQGTVMNNRLCHPDFHGAFGIDIQLEYADFDGMKRLVEGCIGGERHDDVLTPTQSQRNHIPYERRL